MPIPADKYRIVRTLNKKTGEYRFHVETNRWGRWWSLSLGSTFRGVHRAEWGGLHPDSVFWTKWLVNETVAKRYLSACIRAKAYKIKEELRKKQRFAARKDDARKIIKFP